MTRKLFSLTLSAFALLLLMGAGVEQSSAALVSESDGTAAEAAVRQVDAEQDQEADRAEPVPAVAGGSVLTLVENLDRTLTVDGEPVSTEVGKTQRNGTTYVALVPMAKELDPTASAAWDAGGGGQVGAGVHSADSRKPAVAGIPAGVLHGCPAGPGKRIDPGLA